MNKVLPKDLKNVCGGDAMQICLAVTAGVVLNEVSRSSYQAFTGMPWKKNTIFGAIANLFSKGDSVEDVSADVAKKVKDATSGIKLPSLPTKV